MSKEPEPPNPFDPFAAWKTARDSYIDVWSKAMIDLVSTEAFSEAMGRSLDTYLTLSAPIRKVMETTMAELLPQLSMPSRADVVSLAERLTNIETRLDDLDARLDGLQRDLTRETPAPPTPRPAQRTTQGASAQRRTSQSSK